MFGRKENWPHLILTEEAEGPGKLAREDEVDSHSGWLESRKS